MPSIFTKIVNGEIPCYKIYEYDKTFAFLDIHPETKGHTLVIPKLEVDKIYELPDEDYQALMATVKKYIGFKKGDVSSKVRSETSFITPFTF